jgi:PadR family transcriptional regulator PadR
MLTVPTAQVVRALLSGDRYGRAIIATTGLKSGTVYPILGRLEASGWITGEWEPIDPAHKGRPARRYYEMTDTGRTDGARALTELTDQLAAPNGGTTT